MKPRWMWMPFLAALLDASIAFAQGGIPPAPTGHRQPTASQVPADDSVQGLGAGDQAPDTFGPQLRLLPKLDIKSTCRRAQPLGGGEKSAYQSCIDDEVRAQKTLSHKWLTFKAGSRANCSQETRIGGSPSYVELITCLELEQQAAEARIANSKPLDAPGAPRAPAPGRRKGTKSQ
jgi:hypothetical protein